MLKQILCGGIGEIREEKKTETKPLLCKENQYKKGNSFYVKYRDSRVITPLNMATVSTHYNFNYVSKYIEPPTPIQKLSEFGNF